MILVAGLSGRSRFAPCGGCSRGGEGTSEGTAVCVCALYPVPSPWFLLAWFRKQDGAFLKKCKQLLVAQCRCVPPWGSVLHSIAPAWTDRLDWWDHREGGQLKDEFFCKTSPLKTRKVLWIMVWSEVLMMGWWWPLQIKWELGPILGPGQLLELTGLIHESLGEEYLLTSSCSFIANKLSYRVSLNGSKVLDAKCLKL